MPSRYLWTPPRRDTEDPHQPPLPGPPPAQVHFGRVRTVEPGQPVRAAGWVRSSDSRPGPPRQVRLSVSVWTWISFNEETIN